MAKMDQSWFPGRMSSGSEGLLHTLAFKAGDTIISEGDPGETAFYIVDGSVEVSVGQGAKAKSVGALKMGEVFGEMCLIEPGPRSATVKATTNTQCLVTSYDEFFAALEEDPKRAIAFMKILVWRLRQMNDLMERMDPGRRGLRAMFGDWQKSVGPVPLDPDVVALSWMMLW
jgi:CRP/FNR family transcriptional regulator, cyclic AMP receptor protein